MKGERQSMGGLASPPGFGVLSSTSTIFLAKQAQGETSCAAQLRLCAREEG